MSSVGSYLRELRTQRGVSLEEIARFTRILVRHLQALEDDESAALPAPVFTKGFIRAYCQALGVSPDEAFALYGRPDGNGSAEKVAHGSGRPPASPLGTAQRSGAAENGTRGAVFAGFVLLVVLGVALFAMTLWLQPGREPHGTGPAPSPVGPSPPRTAESPQRSALPQASAAPEASRPSPSAVAPGASGPAPGPTMPVRIAGVTAPYRLVAKTSERTWMRVRTEDGRSSEENIPAGETREWISNRPFVLSIGNAGGVALELNGRPVPKLGPSGAVIEQLVLPSDVQ